MPLVYNVSGMKYLRSVLLDEGCWCDGEQIIGRSSSCAVFLLEVQECVTF